MANIIFVSGPCGCGKTTFTNRYAKYLVECKHNPVYVIHGDDFHSGIIELKDTDCVYVDREVCNVLHWEEILQFNWDCIIAIAEKALKRDLDVIIDYIIEGELPRVRELADIYHAKLYYIVLTAESEEIEKRIRKRGDIDLIDRALFLKGKLDTMPENQGYLYDNTEKSPEDMIKEVVLEHYLVK